MRSRHFLWAAALVGSLGLAVLFAQDTVPPAVEQSFRHGQESLSGDLILPPGPGPHPLVVLVHGDGPMPRDGFGYYGPLQGALARAGYASFSWDKPGVGDSAGNWEAQSMADRADEVLAAVHALRSRPDIDAGRVGLWGISQAAWVMPLALHRDPGLAFMISVSGAVSWAEQSAYFTKRRLQQDGYTLAQIQQGLAWNQTVDRWLQTGAAYSVYRQGLAAAPPGCQEPMSESRWNFARRNLGADVRFSLAGVRVPVLALYGEYDRNIDVEQSLAVYRGLLGNSANRHSAVRLFPKADHGLIPVERPVQIDGRGSLNNILRLLRIEFLGEEAFAPGFIDAQLDWLREIMPVGTGAASRAESGASS